MRTRHATTVVAVAVVACLATVLTAPRVAATTPTTGEGCGHGPSSRAAVDVGARSASIIHPALCLGVRGYDVLGSPLVTSTT